MDQYLSKFQEISGNKCLQQVVSQKEKEMMRVLRQHQLREQQEYRYNRNGYKMGGYSNNNNNNNNNNHHHHHISYRHYYGQYNKSLERQIDFFSSNNMNNNDFNNNKQFQTSNRNKTSIKPIVRMFNKRKNKKSSILIDSRNNNRRQLLQLHTDWCYGVDNEEVEFVDISAQRQLNRQSKQQQLSKQQQKQQQNQLFYDEVNDYWRHYYSRHDSNNINQSVNQMMHPHINNVLNCMNNNNSQYPHSNYNYNNQTNNNQYEKYYQKFTTPYYTTSHPTTSIQSLLQRTYPSIGDIEYLYSYDQYGSNQSFSIIHPLSNMVQNRLIFQSTHQLQIVTKLQSISQNIKYLQQRVSKYQIQKQKQKQQHQQLDVVKQTKQKKSGMLQQQYCQHNTKMVDNNNIQSSLSIKLLQKKNQSHPNEQINYLIKPTLRQKQQQQVKRDSHSTNNHYNQNITQKSIISQPVVVVQKDKQLNQLVFKQKSNLSSNSFNDDVFVTVNNSLTLSTKQQQLQQSILPPLSIPKSIPQSITPSIKPPLFPPTLLSLLTQSYFSTIQQKYTRLAKEQRSLKLFYFPSLQQIHWQYLHQQIANIQRVFIIIQSPIVLVKMEIFYTLEKELIKSTVYEFGKEINQKSKEYLRQMVKQQLYHQQVVTFMFKPIDLQTLLQQSNNSKSQINNKNSNKNSNNNNQKTTPLPCSNAIQTKCLLGMLFVLIYQQKVLQKDTPYTLSDYYTKGEQLIDQYLSFYNEQKENTQIQQYTNPKLLFKRVYQNPNVSKINYFFHLQSQQGLVFEKLVDVGRLMDRDQEVEVFMVNKFNDREEEQEGEDYDEGEDNQGDQGKDDNGDDVDAVNQQPIKEGTQLITNNNPNTPQLTNQPTTQTEQTTQPLLQYTITSHSYPFMQQVFDTVLKRSNSRQQLKHFNFDDSQLKRQQQQYHDHNQNDSNVNDYEQQYDDQQQEEYVGL